MTTAIMEHPALMAVTSGTKAVHRPDQQDPNGRPSKRPRISEGVQVAIERREVQSETSLEVDIMILDYLAYQATTACLASRKQDTSSSISVRHNLAMCDTFLDIFQSRHVEYEADEELQFRILLLRFTTLFTQRLTRNPTVPPRKALQDLRKRNRQRANDFVTATGLGPFTNLPRSVLHSFAPASDLSTNRAQVLHALNIPAEDEAYEEAFYGTEDSVALLDLLPLFMELTVARNANGDLKEGWMRLACEFVLQACLERSLVLGSDRSGGFYEAFAWGACEPATDGMHRNVDMRDEEALSMEDVYAMFADDDTGHEIREWTDAKRQVLEVLFPPKLMAQFRAVENGRGENGQVDGPPRPFHWHLSYLQELHPIEDFEATVVGFLADLSRSIPQPVLAQLGSGRLDGMSRVETQQFMQDCGISGTDIASLTGIELM